MQVKKYTHEESYLKNNLASIFHRNRLKTILSVIKKLPKNKKKSWVDFGCSNGFIIEQVKKEIGSIFFKVTGYDHSKAMIELANKKNIINAKFITFDMNVVVKPEKQYDLVTCFETLEHVGNPFDAFKNLYKHLNPNGTIFISMPNELNYVGLAKFLGRYFLRKKPYGDFFNNKSKFNYAKNLVLRKSISTFRDKDCLHYGPHLGFDYTVLENYIKKSYLKKNLLKLTEKKYTLFNSNVFFIYEKI